MSQLPGGHELATKFLMDLWHEVSKTQKLERHTPKLQIEECLQEVSKESDQPDRNLLKGEKSKASQNHVLENQRPWLPVLELTKNKFYRELQWLVSTALSVEALGYFSG